MNASTVLFTRNTVTSTVGNLEYWLSQQPINILSDYAVGAGDVTAVIQTAINDAGVVVGKPRPIIFPNRQYLLSTTLYNPKGISMIGESQIGTCFYRKTDYGDTLVLGSPDIAAVQSVTISDIFFLHDFGGYENGKAASTLVNKPTSGCHIHAYNPVRVKIDKCALWNMPKPICFKGGSDSEINNCSLRGLWDYKTPQLQVSPELIRLEQAGNAQANCVPTLITINNCSMSGYLSESRNVTYGSWSGVQSENIGALVGVRILAGEVINIRGGSIGGCNDCAISINQINNRLLLALTIRNDVGVFYCDSQ